MFGLRQRDSISCGPAVAVVAGGLLDPSYRSRFASGGADFADEQQRVHRLVNRVWPRRLGVTPLGMARALSVYLPYRWRLFRCRRDDLADVRAFVSRGRPVAMLLGNWIPRHWVLLVAATDDGFDCYEPSSGAVRPARADDIRHARLTGLGYPRPFAFVVPRGRSDARAPGPDQQRTAGDE